MGSISKRSDNKEVRLILIEKIGRSNEKVRWDEDGMYSYF